MRVIAGKFKGSKLITFDEENIRPTLDKVREAIFSKIQMDIKDSIFLDLFAGTGAVSIEALSRGAKLVYTCDADRRSEKVIKQNFEKVKAKPNFYLSDYNKALTNFSKDNLQFDFVFLDPPFKKGFGIKAIARIAELNLLADNGLIIFEHSIDESFDYSAISGVTVVDEKKYGTVLVTYLSKAGE